MEGLEHWNSPIQDIFRILRITPSNTTKPIRWSKELYFNSPAGSVREEIAIVVWDRCVQEELKIISSFEKTLDLYSESRPNSAVRIEVFLELLENVDSIVKAQFAVNLVYAGTPESQLANAKLAEF